MHTTELITEFTQPHYIANVVRDGTIDVEVAKVRDALKSLSRSYQALVDESRGTLSAASETTAKIVELWGKVDAQLQSLNTDLSCCDFNAAPSQARLQQWRSVQEKYELARIIKSFIDQSEGLPVLQGPSYAASAQEYVDAADLTKLLQLSANPVLVHAVTDADYSNVLLSLRLTADRMNQILVLGEALNKRMDREIWNLLKSDDELDRQALSHCLIVMDNVGMIKGTVLKEYLIEDCRKKIESCASLEDCVGIMKCFCETILRASTIANCGLSFLGRPSSREPLSQLRREVWKDLALRLSHKVKSILEQQGNLYIQSIVDFQNGLNKVSMAKDLESIVNMMAGEDTIKSGSNPTSSDSGNPRIHLKLRGTMNKLNNFVNSKMSKQYRATLPALVNWNSNDPDGILKALNSVENWPAVAITKAQAIESIDLLDRILILVESLPHEIPDVISNVITWFGILNEIHQHCCPENAQILSYMTNNVIKMSTHSSHLFEFLQI